MNLGSRHGAVAKCGGSAHCRVSIIIIALLLFILIGAGGVSAVQTNESRGPSQYGWQQVLTNVTGAVMSRLTGSADRMNYSWGYKQIQIYTREEDYWAQDCGWWYVGRGNRTGVRIQDAAGDFVASVFNQTPFQGRTLITYNWSLDDDPGRWTVYVNDTVGNLAVFYLRVKGQLNVISITTSASPTAGSPVTVFANVTDNTDAAVPANKVDNTGVSIPPTVTMFVSGAGENFNIAMLDNGVAPDATANNGIYTANFTPLSMGDHIIAVKATDGDRYWVDGRGSDVVSVRGNFPASIGLAAFLQSFGGMADSFDFSSLSAALGGLLGFAAVRRRWSR